MKKFTFQLLLLLFLNCLQTEKSPFDVSNPSSPLGIGSIAFDNLINTNSDTNANANVLTVQVSIFSSMMEGESRTFSVSLSSVPESNITINITGTAGLTVSPTSLLFTSTNFSTAQNVTLTAQEDDTDTIDNVQSLSIGSTETGTEIFSVTVRDNDRRVFVTSITYDGNLGGISGADAKCMSDPNKPTTPSSATYKALLVDYGDTRALGSDWVLQPNLSYRRTNGNLIFVSNANSTFTFGAFANTWSATIAEQAWTGLTKTWGTQINDCENWTSNLLSKSGNVGFTDSITDDAINEITQACNLTKRIICVEQ